MSKPEVPETVVIAICTSARSDVQDGTLRYCKHGCHVKVRSPTIACLRAFMEEFKGYCYLEEPFTWKTN
jgi:hypothetical protein